MILETHIVGPNACNCSIVACPQTRDAVVVDPGGDEELLLERIKALGVNVKYILITHAHFDHVIAARTLREKTGAKVCLHRKDMWLYRIMFLQYRMAGLTARLPPRPDVFLNNGDRYDAGNVSLRVLHTPGHSPGSCCFHLETEKLLFSGDTLFKDSVGNWVYPGGNWVALIESISAQLLGLPDDTRVIPGHGDETTIGAEKATNKYLKPDELEKARAYEATRPGVLKSIGVILLRMLGWKR
ncbi:MAG TPA: MBL fold metallo-hydrolase [Candidatus Obscuribacterales bacterium]